MMSTSTGPDFVESPAERRIPAGVRVLAEARRAFGISTWFTAVWQDAQGRFGAVIEETRGRTPVEHCRHEGLTSLAALDDLLARELGQHGPSGHARLVVLSSAGAAFEAAELKAAA